MTVIEEIQSLTDKEISQRMIEDAKRLKLDSDKYERKVEIEETTVVVSFLLGDRQVTRYEFMNALN